MVSSAAIFEFESYLLRRERYDSTLKDVLRCLITKIVSDNIRMSSEQDGSISKSV